MLCFLLIRHFVGVTVLYLSSNCYSVTECDHWGLFNPRVSLHYACESLLAAKVCLAVPSGLRPQLRSSVITLELNMSAMEECGTSFHLDSNSKFESKPGTEENSMPNCASWYISSSPGADSGDSDSDIIENYFAVEKTEKVQQEGPIGEPPPVFQGLGGAAAVMAAHGTSFVASGSAASIESHAQQLIQQHSLENSFYVVDLGAVVRLHLAWCQAMPRVQPFYAVKCHPNPAVMGVLAALGTGFDCASQEEIRAVTSLGVSPDRIIYAHPCKPPGQIRYAAANNVSLTTFDTESELHKMARWHPSCNLVLRIRADDTQARCQLGNKFGADPVDALALLGTAKDLGLNVVGVSFHVGSGATNPHAFTAAILLARKVFDMGSALGFNMTLLDIGGGFCGGNFDEGGNVDLGGVPAAVNSALEEYFSGEANEDVRVIAEPGRYCCCPSTPLYWQAAYMHCEQCLYDICLSHWSATSVKFTWCGFRAYRQQLLLAS